MSGLESAAGKISNLLDNGMDIGGDVADVEQPAAETPDTGEARKERKPTDKATQDPDTEAPEGEDGEEKDADDAGPESEEGKDGSDEATGDPAEQEQEQELKTFAELAEALGADSDALNALELTIKADGTEHTVTLGELQRGYQREANFTRQTTELAERRTEIENERQQFAQEYGSRFQQLESTLKGAFQMLVQDLNSPEMQALRSTNTAEYMLRKETIEERAKQLEHLHVTAKAEAMQHSQEMQQRQEAELAELERKAGVDLHNRIPDWDDKTRDSVVSYLTKTHGYGPDELRIYDARVIEIANKARLYDEMQAVGAKTKKKITKLPKLQKTAGGNAERTPARVAKSKLNSARGRLKKSGNVRDAADVIANIPGLLD